MGWGRYALSPGKEKAAAKRHKEARTVIAWLMNAMHICARQQADALLSANRVPCQAGSPNRWLTTSGATVCRGRQCRWQRCEMWYAIQQHTVSKLWGHVRSCQLNQAALGREASGHVPEIAQAGRCGLWNGPSL